MQSTTTSRNYKIILNCIWKYINNLIKTILQIKTQVKHNSTRRDYTNSDMIVPAPLVGLEDHRSVNGELSHEWWIIHMNDVH